jgi:hypothetical protein
MVLSKSKHFMKEIAALSGIHQRSDIERYIVSVDCKLPAASGKPSR